MGSGARTVTSADGTSMAYRREGSGPSVVLVGGGLDDGADDAAGGSAHVFGASTGGALALEAAAAGLPVNRLAAYDVPYSVGSEALTRWQDYRDAAAVAPPVRAFFVG